MTAMGAFVGGRLREARVARAMTASSLAERVGITPGAVSQYESGDSTPRPPVMARIADELGLPQAYFLRSVAAKDPAPYLYRSNASSTKRARESAEVRSGWFLEMLAVVETQARLPTTDIDDLGFPSTPSAIGEQEIEAAAAELRRRWRIGDGPVPNMIAVLEVRGCGVTRFAFGADSLDSFSQYAAGRPLIALNADAGSAARARFDAAHELGHLVLHRGVDSKTVWQPEQHKLMETQAHRFAAAFLFPQSAFCDEVYSLSLEALVAVKKRWGVSMQMMVRRARDLGLVNQDKYERACREISRRGYRLREPLDDEMAIETPTVMSKAVRLIIDSGTMSRSDILYKMPFAVSDIEILAHLPRGYLADQKWGEVVDLPRASDSAPPRTQTPGGGTVIQFPSRR